MPIPSLLTARIASPLPTPPLPCPALPAVDMEEEFRLLTLQVIGEAILSLPPEECDRVFPALYLPVMEESNKRVLAPWRQLYPLQAWQYNSRVRQVGRGLSIACRSGGWREQKLLLSVCCPQQLLHSPLHLTALPACLPACLHASVIASAFS